MRICSNPQCPVNGEQELSAFPKSPTHADGHNKRCKVCMRVANAKWYQKNVEYKREYSKGWQKTNGLEKYLKRVYNLTPDEYWDILHVQNYRCAICLVPASLLDHKLAVDHCHKTNQIRGLLCTKCNLAKIGRAHV